MGSLGALGFLPIEVGVASGRSGKSGGKAVAIVFRYGLLMG